MFYTSKWYLCGFSENSSFLKEATPQLLGRLPWVGQRFQGCSLEEWWQDQMSRETPRPAHSPCHLAEAGGILQLTLF